MADGDYDLFCVDIYFVSIENLGERANMYFAIHIGHINQSCGTAMIKLKFANIGPSVLLDKFTIRVGSA